MRCALLSDAAKWWLWVSADWTASEVATGRSSWLVSRRSYRWRRTRAVRAADVLLPMVREWHGRMVWHGFRGKPQQAEQLLRAGIELSFGEHFNADSLRLAYGERKMWLETDDSILSIKEIYERASRALSISPTDIELPGTFWS